MSKALKPSARRDGITFGLPCFQWTRIERAVAVLTIANGTLSLMVSGMRLLKDGGVGVTPLLAILGLLSGILAWQGRSWGHGLALAFYSLQLASYYSYDLTQAYRIGGGLSLAFVVHMPSGVLIVNVLAVLMLAATAVLLCWRMRREQSLQ